MNLSGEWRNFIVGVCHFCEHHGPCVIFHTGLKATEGSLMNNNKVPSSVSNSSCTACNPFGNDHPGFASPIPDIDVSTFSSNWCSSDKIQSQLHQACFRSLSSEVSPVKEGPLFFSDSGIGIHVISHTFFLKDSTARGFQRWFSLIALSSESTTLMKLWNVIVPEMKELIDDLQLMAAGVYQREEEQCSHRMLRSNLHIANNIGAARSLQDITGNPSILLKLHTKLSQIVLLAESTNEVRSLKCKKALPMEDEGILALVRICQEIGPNFKRYARHILKGGSTSVATDDLFFKESCINAIQLLVPEQTVKNIILAQHTLQSASCPYLLVSSQGRKITCIISQCEEYNKVSCIVARLENILLAEEVSPSFIHKQITSIREQVKAAARKMQELKSVEQHKVLQFFQSFGFDCGDMDILRHWSLYC